MLTIICWLVRSVILHQFTCKDMKNSHAFQIYDPADAKCPIKRADNLNLSGL